jgi:hypothetical protein
MVLAGAFALYLLIGKDGGNNQPESTKAIGYSAALLIVGFILPFFAKGRRALVIRMIDETYRWKPRLVVDRASRFEIEQLQNDFFYACRRVGIPTTDPIH